MPSPVEASALEDQLPILAAEGHRAPQPQSRRLRLVASTAVVVAALAALAVGWVAGSQGGAARPSAAQELFHAGLGGHKAASADELPLISKAEKPSVAAEDPPAARRGAQRGGADRSMADNAPLEDFDCEAGIDKAMGGWSDIKKKWCCDNGGPCFQASAESARQAADPSAPLILCTDGTEFKFSVQVNPEGLGTWPTSKDIIDDEGGAFFFLLKEGKVQFVMQTLNSGAVHVTAPLYKDQMNRITVYKDDERLCLTIDTKQPKCTNVKGKQMKIPGRLKWNVGEGVAKEFKQLEGGVPLSFTVEGISDEKLHSLMGSTQSDAYLDFVNAVQSAVALEGGFGVGKSDVTVSTSLDGKDSTTVHVTATNLGTNAPYVCQRLMAAAPTLASSLGARARRRLQDPEEVPADNAAGNEEVPADDAAGDEAASTTPKEAATASSAADDGALTATLEERINAIPTLDEIAATPGEKATVSDTTVPAEEVSCDEFLCGPNMKVQPGLTCVGGECQSVCCGPKPCSEVTCPAGHTNVDDPKATCNSTVSCASNCCMTTCQGECPRGSCPLPDVKGKPVTVANYEKECCDMPEPPCCQMNTIDCLACEVCMTGEEFCSVILSRSEANGSAPADGPARALAQYGKNGGSTGARAHARQWSYSKEMMMAARHSSAIAATANEGTSADLKIQEQLLLNEAAERLEKRVTTSNGSVPANGSGWTYETFDAFKNAFIGRFAAAVPHGCIPDPTPTCSWSLRSTFTPLEGNRGPATTVNVLKAGHRAIVGFQQSKNLYQFNVRTGQPDIPFGRYAEGTLQKYGILVVGSEQQGTVTASALMLDGQQGAVGYSTGGINVFNAGDIYYPPQMTDDPNKLLSTKVNSIAGMPTWKTMLTAQASGWTLMYQYGNGGVIRFPRNYSTMNESIALRQHIITNAYNQRFSTGSNPPLPEDVAQFYKEIAEKINRSATDLDYLNEEVKASWTNEPFDKPVNAVVYVPISTKFATAHGDGKVRYWQSMNGNQLYQMRGHQGPVNCLAAHPTKEIVASGGNDGTVRVWLFVGKGAQILKFQLPGDPPPPVRSLAFLPGGNTLVAGSDDGTLRRYDLRRGEEQCHTLTYAGPTTSMSADPLVPGQIAIGTGSGSAMVYH